MSRAATQGFLKKKKKKKKELVHFSFCLFSLSLSFRSLGTFPIKSLHKNKEESYSSVCSVDIYSGTRHISKQPWQQRVQKAHMMHGIFPHLLLFFCFVPRSKIPLAVSFVNFLFISLCLKSTLKNRFIFKFSTGFRSFVAAGIISYSDTRRRRQQTACNVITESDDLFLTVKRQSTVWRFFIVFPFFGDRVGELVTWRRRRFLYFILRERRKNGEPFELNHMPATSAWREYEHTHAPVTPTHALAHVR